MYNNKEKKGEGKKATFWEKLGMNQTGCACFLMLQHSITRHQIASQKRIKARQNFSLFWHREMLAKQVELKHFAQTKVMDDFTLVSTGLFQIRHLISFRCPFLFEVEYRVLSNEKYSDLFGLQGCKFGKQGK